MLVDPLQKTNKEFKNLKKQEINYIYKNEIYMTCFQHDMAYGNFKDLAKRTASDKALRVKSFNITKNPKYDGYERALASTVYKFFDKTSASLTDKSPAGSGLNMHANNEFKQNHQLAEELQKPIIKNF